MINNILAVTTTVSILPIIILICYAFIVCLIIICLIRVARYFRNAGNEQKLIRMELGKVAEEVHLLRQDIKDDKENNSSDKS
jgi:hypothetical protein